MVKVRGLKHKHAAEALLDLATDCDISPTSGGDWNQVMTDDAEEPKQSRPLRSVSQNQERTKKIKLEDDAFQDSDYENNLVIDIERDSSTEENDISKKSNLECSLDDLKTNFDATNKKEAIKKLASSNEESKNLHNKWLKFKKSRKARLKRKSLKRLLKVVKSVKAPKLEIHEANVEDPDDEDEEAEELEKKVYNEKVGEKNECPICREKFDDAHSFTLHIREHNTDKTAHVCKICSKKLSSASSLDRHMYVHSGERPFECKICSLRFTTNGNMHRHMKTHDSTTGEKIKGKSLDNKSNKRSGGKAKESSSSGENSLAPSESEEDCLKPSISNLSASKSSKCMVCGKEFLSLLSLQRHMQLHTNDPIKCTTCNITSKNYSEYLKHSCPPSNNENPDETDNTKIGFHDLTFLEFSSSKFPLVARNICEKQSRNPSSLFFSWECKTCAKAFPSSHSLNGHEISHENGGMSCETCHCDFSTLKGFENHQLKHRKLDEVICGSTSEADRPKEDFLNSLGLCLKKGSRNKSKSSQDFAHFDNIGYFAQQNFPLPIAETMKYSPETTNDFADIGSIISLTSKAPLPDLRASPVTATPASPLQATAGAVPILPMMESLVDLIETDTPNDGVSSASQSSDFSSRSDTIGKFCCRKCPEQFTSLVDLKQHSYSHAKSTAVHRCNFCSYESNDKSTLKRHLRRHNGEHPFKCSICDYVFTTKANGIRHVRNKHKLADQDASDAVVYNPNMLESKESESETNNNETICKYCKVDFKYNRVLKHHLRSVNNSCSFKPFSCSVCKGGFSTKNNCIRHIMNHHPKHRDMAKKLVVANQICINSPTLSEDGLSGSDALDTSHNEEDSKDFLVANDLSNSGMSLDGDQGESTNSAQHQSKSGNKHLQGLQETFPKNRSPIFLVEELLNKVTEEFDRSKNLEKTKTPTKLSMRNTETPEQPLNLALSENGKNSSMRENFSNDDAEMVSAAESLISLQGLTPLQESPLDLTVSALNLSVKKESNETLDNPEVVNIKFSSNLPNAVKRETSISPFMENNEKAKPPTAHASSEKQASVHIANNLLPPLCLISKVTQKPDTDIPFSPVISPATNIKLPITPVSPVLFTPNNSLLDSTASITESEKGKSSQKVKKFLCEICYKGFTLKSNRERHIKNHHPEYARPPRSRNYLPTLSPIGVHKQNSSTLSDKTRDALRVAIIAKTNNGLSKTDKNSEFPSNMTLTHSSTESEDNSPIKHSKEEDVMSSTSRDVHDLASVSEVIDTVNCQSFREYLNQAKELPTVAPRKSVKNTNSRNGIHNPKAKKSSYTKSTKGILCMFCKRRFPWKSSLSRHLLTHTGVKPHRCPKCPISFTTKSNRDRHLFRQHKDSDTKPYHCNICPDSCFSSRSKLKKHNHTIHGNEKPSRDDTVEHRCSKETADASSGESSLSDDAQDTIECHVCGTSCKTQHDLLKHLKQLHPQECNDGVIVGEDPSSLPSKIKIEPQDPDEVDVQNSESCCDKCLLPFSTENELQNHCCTNSDTVLPVNNSMKSSPKPTPVLPKKSSNSLLYLFAAAQHARAIDSSVENMKENQKEDGNNLILDLLGFKDPEFLEEMLDSAVRSRVKKEMNS